MSRGNDDGFMLMEALVAFVVLTLVLVAVYETLASSYRSRAVVAEKQEALSTARSLFAIAGATGRLPVPAQGTTASGLTWRLAPVTWEAALSSRTSARQDAILLRFAATRANASPILELESIVLLEPR